MSYVALSHVSSLNGLHPSDYDKQKIMDNRNALAEYNWLRMQHTHCCQMKPLKESVAVLMLAL